MENHYKRMPEVTLREFLVAQAMTGLIAYTGGSASESSVAIRAIAYADAVLAELAKHAGPSKA
jgi:hypothetical protein